MFSARHETERRDKNLTRLFSRASSAALPISSNKSAAPRAAVVLHSRERFTKNCAQYMCVIIGIFYFIEPRPHKNRHGGACVPFDKARPISSFKRNFSHFYK